MTTAPSPAVDPDQMIGQVLDFARRWKRPVLIIFSGNNCPWCEKLHGFLGDGTLDRFCQANQIEMRWITLESKEDESAHACEGGSCKIPPRSRYQISSIPTAMFFNKDGERVCSTEYIDEVEQIGGQAYTKWLSANISGTVKDRISLEEAKESEGRRNQLLQASKVRIWSGQWMAWWRPDASGYADEPDRAGIYSGANAWERSKHAGPEKRLAYDILPE
jgi:hypothetical protein